MRNIRTLADIPRLHAKYRPSHPATHFDERTSRIACALRAEGMKKGDRVAYLGSSSDEYFELVFGCAKAGVVLVPVGRLAPMEVAYIVRDAWAKLLFVEPELVDCAGEISSDIPEVRLIVAMQEGVSTDWPSFAQWYGRRPAEDPLTLVRSGRERRAS